MKLGELLTHIQSEMTVKKEWEDGDYLSELLVRLASYYATLGPLLTDAEESQDLAENYYKHVKETEKIACITAGDSVALAESKGVDKAFEDQNTYAGAKAKTRKLFTTRQSLEKTMDAIRSRLRYMSSEKESVRGNS